MLFPVCTFTMHRDGASPSPIISRVRPLQPGASLPRSTVSSGCLVVCYGLCRSEAFQRSVPHNLARNSKALLLKKLQCAQVVLCSLTPLHRSVPMTTPLRAPAVLREIDILERPSFPSTVWYGCSMKGWNRVRRVVSESSQVQHCKLCWFYTYPLPSHVVYSLSAQLYLSNFSKLCYRKLFWFRCAWVDLALYKWLFSN